MRRIVCALVAAAVAAGAVVVVSSVSVAGQSATAAAGVETVKAFIASRVAKGFVAPKAPWGHPDISGVFTTKDEANTPMERPDEWAGRKMDDITPKEFAEALASRQQAAVEAAPFAGGGEPEQGVAIAVPIHWFDNLTAVNTRPWWVIDPPEGKIPPLTAESRERQAAADAAAAAARRAPGFRLGGRRDHYLDRSLQDRCITAFGGSLLRQPLIYGNSYQILQTPDYVVFRYEMVHEARMIPLDGRPHVNPAIRSHFGDSRASWDGNTLVVETTQLADVRNYRGASGTSLRVTERFTRTAPNKVEWTVTLDDPTMWTRPWTYSYPLTEDNSQHIFEYACHEGNFAMANLLTAGRLADRNATGR